MLLWMVEFVFLCDFEIIHYELKMGFQVFSFASKRHNGFPVQEKECFSFKKFYNL